MTDIHATSLRKNVYTKQVRIKRPFVQICHFGTFPVVCNFTQFSMNTFACSQWMHADRSGNAGEATSRSPCKVDLQSDAFDTSGLALKRQKISENDHMQGQSAGLGPRGEDHNLRLMRALKSDPLTAREQSPPDAGSGGASCVEYTGLFRPSAGRREPVRRARQRSPC